MGDRIRNRGAGEEKRKALCRACGARDSDSRLGIQKRAQRSIGKCGRIRLVPTISRFFGIVIAMYFDDHGPPHFHARHTDGAAKVRIDSLEPIESTLGRRAAADGG